MVELMEKHGLLPLGCKEGKVLLDIYTIFMKRRLVITAEGQ